MVLPAVVVGAEMEEVPGMGLVSDTWPVTLEPKVKVSVPSPSSPLAMRTLTTDAAWYARRLCEELLARLDELQGLMHRFGPTMDDVLVQAAGDVLCKLLQCASAKVSRVLARSESVKIGHKIITIKLVCPLGPVFYCAEIGAKGEVAGGLDARKHYFFVFVHNYPSFRGGSVRHAAAVRYVLCVVICVVFTI